MGVKRNSGTVSTPRGLTQGNILIDHKTGLPLETENGAIAISQSSSASNAGADAFGRVRSSTPFGIFDNKNLFDKNENFWNEVLTGGASISYLSDESSVELSVTTANGDRAIRQTQQYFSYVPGKGQLIVMTGVLGSSQIGTVKNLGYYDDSDGMYFQLDSSGMSVGLRSSVTGSIVDTIVPQDQWNLDKMDGTGTSGIQLDTTKAQIFIIDFQWLGVGRIRYGFDIDGKVIYCHEIKNANNITTTYTATATLPLRYEIQNTSAVASPASMKEICCSIASEGGYSLPGFEFSASNGVTTRNITTRTPILAVRLKDSFKGKDNRKTAKILHTAFYAITNDTFFEIAHVNAPSSITATWTSTGTDSAVEYSTDISALTGNPENIINTVFMPTGPGQGGQNTPTGESADFPFVNRHDFIYQNFDSTNSDMFVIYATSFGANSNVSASLTWMEFD